MAYKEIYTGIDFSGISLDETEYENCVFKGCTFSDISGINLSECSFDLCNFSNAKAGLTAIKDCTFTECKLMGVNFSRVKDFGFSARFTDCNLSYVSFDKKKLNKSAFLKCNLNGANFTQADLSKSIIDNCSFVEAVFMHTNISGVDFTTNSNFLIDPNLNNVKKTKFASHSLSGLLYLYDIIIE
jgi:fluoroquinolone resistance protein